MSQTESFKHVLIEALDKLVERKPPKNSIHINHLRTRILTSEKIQMSYIIEKLFYAGYSIEDIFNFLEEAGVVVNQEDWVKLRVALERYIASLRREE